MIPSGGSITFVQTGGAQPLGPAPGRALLLLAACQAPEVPDLWLWSGVAGKAKGQPKDPHALGTAPGLDVLGALGSHAEQRLHTARGASLRLSADLHLTPGLHLTPDLHLTPGLLLRGSPHTGASSPQGSAVLTASFPKGTKVNELGRHSAYAYRDTITKTPRGGGSSRSQMALSLF